MMVMMMMSRPGHCDGGVMLVMMMMVMGTMELMVIVMVMMMSCPGYCAGGGMLVVVMKMAYEHNGTW